MLHVRKVGRVEFWGISVDQEGLFKYILALVKIVRVQTFSSVEYCGMARLLCPCSTAPPLEGAEIDAIDYSRLC